jgi:hypothetical protein
MILAQNQMTTFVSRLIGLSVFSLWRRAGMVAQLMWTTQICFKSRCSLPLTLKRGYIWAHNHLLYKNDENNQLLLRTGGNSDEFAHRQRDDQGRLDYQIVRVNVPWLGENWNSHPYSQHSRSYIGETDLDHRRLNHSQFIISRWEAGTARQ